MMNLGESKEILTGYQEDLETARTEPERNWYETEMRMQSDYREALGAQQFVGNLAQILSNIRESGQLPLEPTQPPENPSLPETYVLPVEKAEIELIKFAHQITDRYSTDLVRETINIGKKSKKDHIAQLLQRKLMNNFESFGKSEQHIIHDPEALKVVLDNLDDDLAGAVLKNACEYATDNAIEITSDAKAFANIIRFSAEDNLSGDDFDHVLEALYKNVTTELAVTKMHINLASAALELIGNVEGLKRALSIAYLSDKCIKSKPEYLANFQIGRITSYLAGDTELLISSMETSAIFDQLTEAFPGISNDIERKVDAHINSSLTTAIMNGFIKSGEYPSSQIEEANKKVSELHNFISKLIGNNPVTFTALGDDPGMLGDKIGSFFPETDIEWPAGFKDAIKSNTLHRKRIEHLATIADIRKLSTKVLKTKILDWSTIPLTPNKELSMIIPTRKAIDGEKDGRNILNEVFHAIKYELVVADHDISSVSDFTDESNSSVMTSCIVDDESRLEALYFIHHKAFGHYDRTGSVSKLLLPLEKVLARSTNELDLYADILLKDMQGNINAIAQHRKRYLGRRPVAFKLPDHLQEVGMKSIKVSHKNKRSPLQVDIEHQDGTVSLMLAQDFKLIDSNGERKRVYTLNELYVGNLVSKLVKIWVCTPTIHTSEGAVSNDESKDAGKVNMGRFVYLPIMDGKYHNFSDNQWDVCVEEKGADLEVESERLRHLDETGQARNSTYRREKYDPSKPPLDVYYDKSAIS